MALSAMAVACSSVLLAVARPVPLELPVLALDPNLVREQLAEDARLAAGPASALAQEFYRVLLEAGRAEYEQDFANSAAQQRHIEALRKRALPSQELRTMQAYATERFMRALSSRLSDIAEEHGLVGAHYSFMLQHGYVAQSGNLLAPQLTVRATYKVRWNMLFGYASTAGLSRIERIAYEGFRALEAYAMPEHARYDALKELMRLAPEQFEEAVLIWQAQQGRPGALLEYMDAGAWKSASLRLRNMALSTRRSEPPI